jgi:hypothetical protein
MSGSSGNDLAKSYRSLSLDIIFTVFFDMPKKSIRYIAVERIIKSTVDTLFFPFLDLFS